MNDFRTPSDSTEDADVQRPKWLGTLIIVFMALIALGVFNVGWLIMKPSAADKAMQARIEADPSLLQGKTLLEASSCLSCHKASSKAVGPSFVDVAERYQTRGDAQAYVADRIRNGSVGEWGKIAMPRQSQVSQTDALLMAKWVLSHAQAADANAAPAAAASAAASARATASAVNP